MANKFKEGDKVVATCKKDNPYFLTCEGWEGEVVGTRGKYIIVKPIGKYVHEGNYSNGPYDVQPKYFKLKNTKNMKQTLTGYKVTNSYPGGPAVGTVVGITDKIAPLMPECYQPIYKNESAPSTLTIGTNGMEVIVSEGSIRAGGTTFTRTGLDQLRKYLRRVTSATPIYNTGNYAITLKENWRFIRIGCTDEDHRVSLEELDRVIAEYDKING